MTRSVPCISRPMPSAWQSLPGPDEQRSTRDAAAGAHQVDADRAARGADQHRAGRPVRFGDDVEHGMDAVGAIDVERYPARPTSPRPAPCAGEPRATRDRRRRDRPRSRRCGRRSGPSRVDDDHLAEQVATRRRSSVRSKNARSRWRRSSGTRQAPRGGAPGARSAPRAVARRWRWTRPPAPAPGRRTPRCRAGLRPGRRSAIGRGDLLAQPIPLGVEIDHARQRQQGDDVAGDGGQ